MGRTEKPRGRRFWIFGLLLSLALIGSGLGILVWEFEAVEKVDLMIAGWIYIPVRDENDKVQGLTVTVVYGGWDLECGVENFGVEVQRGNTTCVAVSYHTLEKVEFSMRRRWSVLRGTLNMTLVDEESFRVRIHAETVKTAWFVTLSAVSMITDTNFVWLNTLDLGEV